MNLQHNNQFLTTLILMGQLELRDIINSQPQFKQRFAMLYVLKTLSEKETEGYIKHRLKIAGAKKDIFEEKALALIYKSSNGRPRQINNICDMSLLIGSMKGLKEINADIVRDVEKDLGEKA
jgi:type II secretory pathway predicted ATPase ExeA